MIWSVHFGYDAALVRVVDSEKKAQQILDDLQASDVAFADEWDVTTGLCTGRKLTTEGARG